VATDVDDLRARFVAGGSLARAIMIGLAERPAWTVVDVVVQDEFTHDVIFVPDGGGPAIVLDCT
jgi:hypothetical protein